MSSSQWYQIPIDLICPTGDLFVYEFFIKTFYLRTKFVVFYSLLHSVPENGKNVCKADLVQVVCIRQNVSESLENE